MRGKKRGENKKEKKGKEKENGFIISVDRF